MQFKINFKKSIIIFVLLVSVVIIGQSLSVSNGNPETKMLVSPSGGGTAPLNVTFTDISTGNFTSWLWEFGDGKNSTEQNTVHKYTKSGKYKVIFEACNQNGCKTGNNNVFIAVCENGYIFDKSKNKCLKPIITINSTKQVHVPELNIVVVVKAGCPACAVQEPIIADLKNVTEVPIQIVDIKTNREAISKYHINWTPTTIIFRNGKQYSRFDGQILSKEDYLQAIENASLS